MTFFDDSGSTSNEDWQSMYPSPVASPAVRIEDCRASSHHHSTQAQRLKDNSDYVGSKSSIQLRRRESLPVQQDQLWEIEQGFIKALTWDDQGCTLTLGIWGPGDLVGSPLGNIAPYQLSCITPVQVRSLTFRGGYPNRFLYNQAQLSQELLGLFRCRCLETRLLDMLWWLAGRFGHSVPAGYVTGVPLTHQELADLLGSTRVTMTRMLRELGEAGELERLDQRQILLTGKPRNLGIRSMQP